MASLHREADRAYAPAACSLGALAWTRTRAALPPRALPSPVRLSAATVTSHLPPPPPRVVTTTTAPNPETRAAAAKGEARRLPPALCPLLAARRRRQPLRACAVLAAARALPQQQPAMLVVLLHQDRVVLAKLAAQQRLHGARTGRVRRECVCACVCKCKCERGCTRVFFLHACMCEQYTQCGR